MAHQIATSKSGAIMTLSVNSKLALRLDTTAFLRIYYWDFSLHK